MTFSGSFHRLLGRCGALIHMTSRAVICHSS